MSLLDLPPCPPIAIEPTMTALGWSMEATYWNDTHLVSLLRHVEDDAVWSVLLLEGGREKLGAHAVLPPTSEHRARKLLRCALADWEIKGPT